MLLNLQAPHKPYSTLYRLILCNLSGKLYGMPGKVSRYCSVTLPGSTLRYGTVRYLSVKGLYIALISPEVLLRNSCFFEYLTAV
jgi:hypothetical protein